MLMTVSQLVVGTWVLALATAAGTGVRLAVSRHADANLRRSVSCAAVAVLPTFPLMLEQATFSLFHEAVIRRWLGPLDIVVWIAALTGLVLGPLALARSLQISPVAGALVRGNLVRGLLLMCWALGALATVLTMLST